MELRVIQACFGSDKVLYSRHARDEMQTEELGIVSENDVFEAVMSGKIIEDYPNDEPYPSCLVYGRTTKERPVHVVCAYAGDADIAIVVTVYQPTANRWIDFERRRKA
ncbi:MAG: DUF4258 domain-containing protein [Bacteroidetes bacterium]|nr:DUF4258 domain-containing protein [Bacteroidota bacterium]